MQSSTSSPKITAEIVARALDPDAKADSRGYMARCPVHADEKASLRVGDRDDGVGGVWFHCFAGCDAREVYRACQARGIKTGSDKAGKTPVVVRTYAYNFYDGSYSTACVQRWGRPDGGRLPRHQPKTTWARFLRDTETGELFLAENAKPALPYDIAYMGDRLTSEETVFVVEGEKDCETLWGRYLAAIGIGINFKWSDETAALLKGRGLVLVPDNDPAGQRAMERFGLDAVRAGVDVAWLTLPDVGEKEDVTDWFEKHGGTSERLWMLASTLEALGEEDLGWRGRLDIGRNGDLKATYLNAALILERAPEFRGRFSYDAFFQNYLVDGQEPSDGTATTIGQEAYDSYRFSSAHDGPIRTAMIAIAERSRFDSLQEHVTGLPAWDGVKRLDTWLERYAGAENGFSRLAGRKFLIGMIARAMDPGCKFDTALVLEGGQGPGKSTLCSILGGRFYSGDMPELRDKARAAHALQGVWLMEDAEMDSSSKAENKRLKAFLSLQEDHYRPPYGRHVIRAPRRTVFVITTNQTEAYFADETGGRRLWPVMCERELDLAGLARDRDQLLAEAYAAWIFGEPYWFEYGSTEAEVQGAEIAERSSVYHMAANEDIERMIASSPAMQRGKWTPRERPLTALHLRTMHETMISFGRIPANTSEDRYSADLRKALKFKKWRTTTLKFKGEVYRVWVAPGAKPPYEHNLVFPVTP